MLNPIKSTTTLDAVRRVELVPPSNAGKDWKGVPHGRLLTSLLKHAAEKGLEFKPHALQLGRHGYDLAAGLVLDKRAGLPKLRDGWRYGLGVATSNANRYRLRFYVGAYRETDADAATWTAVAVHAFRASKRYTLQFDLAAEVEAAVDRWRASAAKLGARLDRLAAAELPQDDAQRLLIDAVAARLTPGSRAFQAIELIAGRRKVAALDLLAAFGATAAKNPPDVQQDQLLGFFNRVRDKVAPPKTKTAK